MPAALRGPRLQHYAYTLSEKTHQPFFREDGKQVVHATGMSSGEDKHLDPKQVTETK